MLDRRRVAQRLLEDLEHRHGLAAPRRVRRVITTFASLARSRCATAGAAKPEKTGTWTAPMCAQACEATATSGDIGRKIPTRSPGFDAEGDERARRAASTSRESSANVSSRRAAVLAQADRRDARRASRARPAVHAVPRRSRRVPPMNHVVHSGRRESSKTCVHGSRELEPQVLDASGQNHSGSSIERRTSSC